MDLLWKADLGDGRYQNPILYADYSDPDIIRVEDTYYMTASSFNYTPGLPILTSVDLVNWKLVNYAVDNISYDRYDHPEHAKGIWAPAIRFHEGEFYIYYGMPDEGIFMVHTKEPLGRWSAQILVLEGKGLIDACPLWDTDGHAYVVHGYARSRIGFKSILGLFPMSWDGTNAIGDDHFIYRGIETQQTIEGPKIYRRGEWYYIFAPAGGVKTGWQTVLRSKDIHGPYEEKIVMQQGDTPVNGPHQGGLTDTPDGNEWFVHFQDRGIYGRITHLQPVVWQPDGWPIIGEATEKSGCGQPYLIHEKPAGLPISQPCYPESSDEFDKGKPGLMWQWPANHQTEFWSMDEKIRGLRLHSWHLKDQSIMPLLWDCPNLLTQKISCPEFMAHTEVDIKGLQEGEMTGLIMLGGQYAYLAVIKKSYQHILVYAESEGNENCRKEQVLWNLELNEGIHTLNLGLQLTGRDEPKVRFGYGQDKGRFTWIENTFIPKGHTWVGARFGIFAVADGTKESRGYADFAYMRVTAQEAGNESRRFI